MYIHPIQVSKQSLDFDININDLSHPLASKYFGEAFHLQQKARSLQPEMIMMRIVVVMGMVVVVVMMMPMIMIME